MYVCLYVRKITFQLNGTWPRYFAWRFMYRSSLTVKVKGLSSRSQGTFTGGNIFTYTCTLRAWSDEKQTWIGNYKCGRQSGQWVLCSLRIYLDSTISRSQKLKQLNALRISCTVQSIQFGVWLILSIPFQLLLQMYFWTSTHFPLLHLQSLSFKLHILFGLHA